MVRGRRRRGSQQQWTMVYDPLLLDAFFSDVFPRLVERRSGLLGWRYRRALNTLYERTRPEDRDAGFFALQVVFWRELGYERRIEVVLDEFGGRLDPALPLGFGLARTPREEGADLVDGVPTMPRLLLHPDRLSDLDGLAVWLRHELTHLADLLDPTFGYDPYWHPSTPAMRQRVAQRYRLLWGIYADGRSVRRGHPPLYGEPTWRDRFREQYPCRDEAEEATLFSRLWSGDRLTHPELLVLAETGVPHRAQPGRDDASACPLCRFPTYAWAAITGSDQEVTQRVRADFPHWSPDQGVCAHCWERYTLAPC